MKAAKAMGYKSVQAIYLWPDFLSTAVADRVTGALARIKPAEPVAPKKSQTAIPEEKFERLADGLQLQDRRQAQQPFTGPDKRLAGTGRSV